VHVKWLYVEEWGGGGGGGGLMRIITKIHIWLNSDKNNKPALTYNVITNTYNVLWHIFCTKIICKCHNTDRNVWYLERIPLQAQ